LRYRDADHPDQTQLTPAYVLDLVRRDLGGIGLDPCTIDENPTAARAWFTVDTDGLAQPWDAETIFVNPPYGKAREPWVERCIDAGARGARVILLMPSATDTRIFRRAAVSAQAIVFVVGRLKFGTLRPNRRQHAASHPSALLGWNTDLAACSALGWSTSATRDSGALPSPNPSAVSVRGLENEPSASSGVGRRQQAAHQREDTQATEGMGS
jgi:hypothetical protein